MRGGSKSNEEKWTKKRGMFWCSDSGTDEFNSHTPCPLISGLPFVFRT